MAQQHEWMTDGISLDASEKILAEYESEGWEVVSISWDSDTGVFMGVWKRPVVDINITPNLSAIFPDDVYGAVGRLRAWIKDFGDQKQPEFVSDLQIVLRLIVNAE
tara:strand:- start:1199 stop:1516 length:318 start_codon:yes stop_codon:yes gene_type:complete